MSCIYVTSQGSKLRKVAGQYVITRKEETLGSLPGCMVEAVLLFGQVQVTSQAVQALLADGVPLLYLTRGGGFRGILLPGYPRNAEVRMHQYRVAMDPHRSLCLAKSVADIKLYASGKTLRRWRRNRWHTGVGDPVGAVSSLRDLLQSAETLETVRALEARAARVYFEAFGASLPPEFDWNGRNRQPPRDPVNAMLSLSYMLLLGRMVASCFAGGLDPMVGFLHQLAYSRPSLALDLLEPFRSLACDHVVLRSLQAEGWSRSDFQTTPEKGCRFTESSLKRWLELFQNTTDPGDGKNAVSRMMPMVLELKRSLADDRCPDWESCWEETV